MTRRILMAAALAAAFAVWGQSSSPLTAQSVPTVLVPGTTTGLPFEDLPGTVFNWDAESWNRIRFPEAFNGTGWNKSAGGTGSNPVVTPDVAAAPDGTMTADQVVFDRGAGNLVGDISHLEQPLVVPAGSTWTFSVWMKSADANTYNVKVTLSDGGIVYAAAGSTWVRYSATYTTTATSTTARLGLRGTQATSAYANVLVWGAQVVRGPVPLPYKSNPGATVGGAGDTLVMNGPVPLVTTTAAYPRGFGAGRRFVGPFTANTNYFRLGGGADVLDFAGDFTICIGAKVNESAGNPTLISNGAFGVAGYTLQVLANGSAQINTYGSGAARSTSTSNTYTVGALTVVCYGRDGASQYVKMNGGATATGATYSIAAPGSLAYIGNVTWNGLLHEVWFSTTPWSEANVAAIQARAMADGDDHDPLFPDDANTVLHLRGDAYDGTTWKAPQAALTTFGTVGYSDAYVPPVAGTRQANGYGAPFSDANYLTFGTASDVMDLDAPWSYCVAYTPAANYSASGRPYTNGDTTSRGSSISVQTNGVYHIINGASKGAGSATFGALNVTCCGYDGVSSICKTNRGALATTATAYSLGTTVQAYFGRSNSAGSSFNGSVHAFWASTLTPSDALFTRIIDRALGQTDAANRSLSITRATTETYEVPTAVGATPSLFTAPAGVAAVGPTGTQVWRQSTNGALQSQTTCVANAAQAPWAAGGAPTCVSDSVVAPDGTTTMDVWTSGVVGATIEAPVTLSSTNTAAYSVWLQKPSGNIATLFSRCTSGTATACSCSVSGSGTCVATVGNTTAADCKFRVTGLTTTPSRVTSVQTCAAATTSWRVWVAPDDFNVATGSVGVWGVQVESQPYPTPYIATTTAAVQRNADAITTTHGLLPGDRSWCVGGTYTPGTWTWNSSTRHGLWSAGTEGQSDSAWLALEDGLLTFGVKSASWQDGLVTFDVASTGALTTSEPHAVKACVVDGNRMALYWDGQPVAAATNGGDLTWTPPTTFRLGALSTAGNEWDGGIREFAVERAALTPSEVSALDTVMLGSYQFAATGQTIPHSLLGGDAAVVAHVVWNGTALVDTTGLAWTQNGVVPQTTAAQYPQGFASTARPAAGPFTSANSYKVTGTDLATYTGDFYVCWVYTNTTTTGPLARALGGNGVYGGSSANGQGWQLTDTKTFYINGANVASFAAAPEDPVLNAMNVLCAGKVGGRAVVKLNFGAYTTGAASITYVPATTPYDVTYLGQLASPQFTSRYWPSPIMEFIYVKGTPSDAIFTAIHRHVLGLTGNAGPASQQAVSLTRATTKTCELPDEGGTVYTVPAGAPCINKKGLLVEPQRTNAVQYSEKSCVGGAVQAPWAVTGTPTCVADAQVAPDGTTTMDEWTSALNSDVIYQSTTLTSTATAVGSVWFAKAAGTGVAALRTRCVAGTSNTCTCWTSDGSACTAANASPVATDCLVKATAVTTTPVRVAAVQTCAAATTSWMLLLNPGDYNVATGTARVWGAQHEAGTYPTSYIPAAATVQRNADAPTVVNALAAANPGGWCIGGRFTTQPGHTLPIVGGSGYWWAVGADGTANSYRAYAAGTLFLPLITYDGAVAQKDIRYTPTTAWGTLTSCNNAGTLSAYLDGVLQATAINGAGSGVITHGTPIYLGTASTGAANLGGYLRNFRLCATADNRRCY